jgi:glyceraldehyde 3-phosphate dehydrogenase
MTVRVAINGFGRIGRLVLRSIYEEQHNDIEVVAINDLSDVRTSAYLLQHDTAHGKFPFPVGHDEKNIIVNNKQIPVYAERDPANLPWGDLGVDIAMECTGFFTKRDDAAKHLTAGAKKVIVSAPSAGADLTVVYGVNDDQLTSDHKVISNASCTTNCLAPVASVLDAAVGIESGYMTTIHSYTGDQVLVDSIHKDLRRARAAAQNIIPTSTGAAKAVGLVLPHLHGKLDGTAIRVPTQNVSLVDFNFIAKKETSVAEINDAIVKASQTDRLKGILMVCEEELVSSDFNHCPASSTFDVTQTQVVDKKLVRVLSWYDNEWGFSNRMSDTALKFHSVQ